MNLFQSNQLEFAWWVEINTNIPRCIYYFGPFNSEKEAQLYKSGYVEDLQRFRLLCNIVFSLPLSYHRFQLLGCTS